MNLRGIGYYLGLFCFPISILAFINILYSSHFDYFLNVDSYILVLFSSATLGLSLFFIGKNSTKRINFFDQLYLIILTYLVASFFISIPFYFSNSQITFINAYFESISGVTGTGFTIFDNIKYLDPTLILWRSSSQWIGGFYFLIFLVVIFSNKQFNYKLNNLTYNNDGSVNTENNLKKIILKIFLIYFLTSFIIFIVYNALDIRLFNSLNLTMTVVSAGGFLPTNNLDQIIKTNGQELFLFVSLTLAVINFFFVSNIFNRRKISSEHNEDFLLISFIIFSALAIYLTIENLNLTQVLISVASSLSNSGITLNNPPQNISLYFLFLSIIGGSLISNTSGIKLMRIYILLKSTSFEILQLVRPNNVFNQNILYSEKIINNDNLKSSFLIFISFFISLFFLSGFLLADNINFEKSFKLSILTLTNTVDSELFGITKINFSNMLTTSKISLIIFMIIGKIELLSFFLIIKNTLFKN